MSITKVFHTLVGNKNIVLLKEETRSDRIIFHGRVRDCLKKCAYCGSCDVRIKDTKERSFRALNLGQLRTYLKIPVYKLRCKSCKKCAWMQLPFVAGKLPMTKSLISYVIQLISMATLLSVSIFLGLQWKTVKGIDKENLKKRAKQFSFKKLRYISIDEIAIKKGHNYMTIFSDIATGQIIHAVEGRSEEATRGFLKLLKQKAKRLRGIAIDMSAAYASAIKIHLPHVSIVYDRFHVTKLLTGTLDEIRRSEQKKCLQYGIDVIKGDRFLLLRNFSTLEKDKQSRLEKLLEINKPLAIAHSMKEQFRMLWEQGSVKQGSRFLVRWIMEAFESGVELLSKVASSLLRYSEGLLSYFEHRIDNGKAEGINNKIKVLKRQAYGFRDMEYFKLKLYNLHKQKSELVG